MNNKQNKAKKVVGMALATALVTGVVTSPAHAEQTDSLKPAETQTQKAPQKAVQKAGKHYDIPMKLGKPVLTLKKGQRPGGELIDVMQLSAKVEVDGFMRGFEHVTGTSYDTINFDKVGEYPVTFAVNVGEGEDYSGNTFSGKVRGTVKIIDNNAPTSKFKNGGTITAHVGDTLNPADYVTATDVEDGDISNTVEAFINNQLVTKFTQEGTFKIKFDVNDSDGNVAETLVGTVNVLPAKDGGDGGTGGDTGNGGNNGGDTGNGGNNGGDTGNNGSDNGNGGTGGDTSNGGNNGSDNGNTGNGGNNGSDNGNTGGDTGNGGNNGSDQGNNGNTGNGGSDNGSNQGGSDQGNAGNTGNGGSDQGTTGGNQGNNGTEQGNNGSNQGDKGTGGSEQGNKGGDKQETTKETTKDTPKNDNGTTVTPMDNKGGNATVTNVSTDDSKVETVKTKEGSTYKELPQTGEADGSAMGVGIGAVLAGFVLAFGRKVKGVFGKN
ncbi:LPXTG cell wall anchor domain-containing protein [Bacillus thuringiensis]|uniref:LPXTG cell wall anchor domain-containing protein n=1 Tax=Bacillus thuringiensis TaxID=1428 RepID=UPI001145C775|nr:LPXTG cell wall anchor domain-containing protein [Bacillus thuringiensis]